MTLPPARIATLGTKTSRRRFCVAAGSGAAAWLLPGASLLRAAQAPATAGGTPTRPDVAAIDRERILAAAGRYLAIAPTPIPSLRCERSPGTAHDYYSEAEPDEDAPADAKKKAAAPAPFTAHRDALFTLGLAVPALAAAYSLTGEERYAQQAAVQLRAWFVDGASRMTPRLDFGQTAVGQTAMGQTAMRQTAMGQTATAEAKAHDGGRMEGILETLPLVEVVQAIPFLMPSASLTDSDRAGLNAWFTEYLRWLTQTADSGPRLAALARDHKDHHASSWLLQVTAYSLFVAAQGTAPKAESAALEELRHRYRTTTLRAQINATGTFPHELSTSAPYRNSLLNLDLLAAVCLLLSTRFDNVWEYQLEDGPSMRSAIAYHFPFIADRTKWPFRADAAHFDQLPGRRASLLFCARAYQRPEYAALWMKPVAEPVALEVLRSIPIHQPLLWVRQPPRV
jgi:hypothetical protein